MVVLWTCLVGRVIRVGAVLTIMVICGLSRRCGGIWLAPSLPVMVICRWRIFLTIRSLMVGVILSWVLLAWLLATFGGLMILVDVV